jgi:hypothetical protein
MLYFTSQHHKFSGNQNEALKFKHRSLNKDGRCVAPRAWSNTALEVAYDAPTYLHNLSVIYIVLFSFESPLTYPPGSIRAHQYIWQIPCSASPPCLLA